MNTSQSIRRKRRHSTEFKQGLVALCQPSISVSAVALAHGINANLLRRWIKQFAQTSPVVNTPAKLLPIQVDFPAGSAVSDVIEIRIQKGRARIDIRWPNQHPHACGLWLTELLK